MTRGSRRTCGPCPVIALSLHYLLNPILPGAGGGFMMSGADGGFPGPVKNAQKAPAQNPLHGPAQELFCGPAIALPRPFSPVFQPVTFAALFRSALQPVNSFACQPFSLSVFQFSEIWNTGSSRPLTIFSFQKASFSTQAFHASHSRASSSGSFI